MDQNNVVVVGVKSVEKTLEVEEVAVAAVAMVSVVMSVGVGLAVMNHVAVEVKSQVAVEETDTETRSEMADIEVVSVKKVEAVKEVVALADIGGCIKDTKFKGGFRQQALWGIAARTETQHGLAVARPSAGIGSHPGMGSDAQKGIG